MRNLVQAALEHYFSQHLGAPIMLSYGEYQPGQEIENQDRWLDGKSPDYKRDWQSSRKALMATMKRLGDDGTLSELEFPNTKYSMSHSDGLSWVVGTSDSLKGLGIDFEFDRWPKVESARFFLTPKELSLLDEVNQEQKPEILVRLWTIKEAVFKADTSNNGRGVKDYEITSLDFDQGEASVLVDGSRQRFKFSNFFDGKCSLSVAVAV